MAKCHSSQTETKCIGPLVVFCYFNLFRCSLLGCGCMSCQGVDLLFRLWSDKLCNTQSAINTHTHTNNSDSIRNWNWTFVSRTLSQICICIPKCGWGKNKTYEKFTVWRNLPFRSSAWAKPSSDCWPAHTHARELLVVSSEWLIVAKNRCIFSYSAHYENKFAMRGVSRETSQNARQFAQAYSILIIPLCL